MRTEEIFALTWDDIDLDNRNIHHELGINCISLRNSCEIKDIAEVLGYKRIETTENYYITSSTNDLIKIIEKEVDINLSEFAT